ncbi:hypothetical protein HPB50_012259 [Hyalomma asiaticum]|uniref:Uncharacterized protein n=1 Tax=Hyalomma asiaticum TaxID=266040 RepID=A0ACB7SAS8_HYAAI|nr:hypothetical protein HPB50_012259 [Hyalomma asiaticum]
MPQLWLPGPAATDYRHPEAEPCERGRVYKTFDDLVWVAVFVCLICLSGLLALGGWETLLTRRRKCASLLGSAYRHGWDLFGLLFAESTSSYALCRYAALRYSGVIE